MHGKRHHYQNATSLPNPNHPMADMPLPWQHLSPTGVQRSTFPLSTIVRGQRPFLPASWLQCLALSRSQVWGPLLFHDSSPSPHIYILPCYQPGCSSLVFSTSPSHHFSLLSFQFPSRGSKMIPLLNHPSTARARWRLAPVLTRVHLPAAHARDGEGSGTGTRWAWGPSPGSLCRSGQVTQLSVKSKHPLLLVLLGSFNVTPCCSTLPGTGEPTDTASLLFHGLLNYLLTSKDKPEFLLPTSSRSPASPGKMFFL